MQTCSQCNQLVSEKIRLCPKCGQALPDPLRTFAGHAIERILNETEHTTLYKAVAGASGPVVIRRFHDPLSDGQVARLRNDVDLINGIEDAHLIPILQFGVTDAGDAFRIKPFIEGKLLSQLAREGHFKNLQNAHWAMSRLAESFTGLHRAGILATYMVTDDILVSRPKESRNRAIHVDINGSRFLHPATDEPGPALRFLMKHHPELGDGKSIAPTSDIYTLGSIYHELLTGERPHATGSDHAPARVPEPFANLVMRMLDPIAHRRPSDPDVVLGELEKLSLIRSRVPESRSRQTSRRKILSGLAAVAAVTLITWWAASNDHVAPRNSPYGATPLEQARRSVVFIQTRYTYRYLNQDREAKGKLAWSTGTGFLVDANTIATAAHVIAPWCFNGRPLDGKVKQFRFDHAVWPLGAVLKGIISPSGKSPYVYDEALVSWGSRPAVGVLALDEEHDLALLRLDAPLDTPPLRLAATEDYQSLVQRLRPVTLIGFPKDSQDDNRVNPVLSSGSIAQLTRAGFTADLANHKGFSGGPVLDPGGRVLGVATNTVGGEHDFTKAASILFLAQLLSRSRTSQPDRIWTP